MTKPIHFEKSIAELEEIVARLDKGELSLEESLKQFEKGMSLSQKCQEILNQAEQKIEILAASKTKDANDVDK